MATPNMTLVPPVEDGSSGTWDTLLNEVMERIDLHDHTSGLGVPIPTAGIDLDADLPFGGFAATGVKAIDFNAVTTIASGYLTSLFVDSGDGELYWRTAGGVNVQLTDGNTLNAASLGGITGDYGTGDEEVSYSSSSFIYNFLRDDSPVRRAFIDTADIRLFESANGITNAVKLISPTALAASYTITFPTALPGSTSLMLMSAAGVLSTSRTPTIDTLTTTAGVEVGGGFEVGAGAEFAGDVLVNGAFYSAAAPGHGDTTKNIALVPMALITGVTAFDNEPVLEFGTTADSGGFITIPFSMETGQRIRSVDFHWDFTTAGSAGDIDCDLRTLSSAGVNAQIATAPTVNGTDQTVTLAAVNHTVLDNTSYFVRFSPGGGWDRVAKLVGVRITFDRP